MIAAASAVTACAPVSSMHRSAARVSAGTRVAVRPAPVQPPVKRNADGASAIGANGQEGKAPAAPLEPLSPFDDSPVIFTVAGSHFARGERVIVTICLGADHSIARADIFESSGDSKFDQLALNWAQRVKLRAAAQGEQVATCGAVRVEVRPAQEPRVLEGPPDSVS